jgi:hypothetical protein
MDDMDGLYIEGLAFFFGGGGAYIQNDLSISEHGGLIHKWGGGVIFRQAYIHKFTVCLQKTSIPPPRRKLEVNPPTPFGCPNTFTIIRNNFVSPPPPDSRNFLRGGSVDLFWNQPMGW